VFSLETTIKTIRAGNLSLLWDKSSRVLERLLLAVGVVLMTICAAALLHRTVSSHLALWQFDRAQAAAQHPDSVTSQWKAEQGIDFSLWGEKRVLAYRDSLVTKKDVPLAVLEIHKLRIRVPVFDGTDDLTLNRGVGRIIGTARPGETGNIGIAGHRDGFFRGLKDISEGDEIDLTTTDSKATYIVDQIEIVSPADVRVLQPRPSPSITLVTCYPFYFVGDAPKRFIVHASLASGRVTNKVKSSSSIRRQNCRRTFALSVEQEFPRSPRLRGDGVDFL
jgi:sortase A